MVIFQKNIVNTYLYSSPLRNVSGGNGSYTVAPYVSRRTVKKKIVAETEFARCEYHTVKPEGGGALIKDWLFLEERPAVNAVIVDEQGNFLVYQQEKYAIPGETLSIVGGFVEDNESPYMAAIREVMEEMGMGSRGHRDHEQNLQEVNQHQDVAPEEEGSEQEHRKLSSFSHDVTEWDAEIGRISNDDPDWVYLGKYRTAANRGGGFTYSYLLKNAVPILPNGGTNEFQPEGDDEKLDLLYLNENDIMDALSRSAFKEVKWTATLALAMLHIRENMPGQT